MGNRNLKAIVVKSTTKIQMPADKETFQKGHRAS